MLMSLSIERRSLHHHHPHHHHYCTVAVIYSDPDLLGPWGRSAGHPWHHTAPGHSTTRTWTGSTGAVRKKGSRERDERGGHWARPTCRNLYWSVRCDTLLEWACDTGGFAHTGTFGAFSMKLIGRAGHALKRNLPQFPSGAIITG